MNSDKIELGKAQRLREQAERLSREEAALQSADIDALSKAEINRLIHELQVHQIELQLQNEELKHIQAELEASQAKYFELYNLAPVGYLTLNDKGIITEANLTFSKLTGCPRQDIVKKPLSQFILPDDQDIWYKYKKQMQNAQTTQVCELRLTALDGIRFWAHIEATSAQDKDSGEITLHLAIIDITGKKHQELVLDTQNQLLEALINSPEDIVIFSLDREYRYTAFNKQHVKEMQKVWHADIQIGDRILDFMTIPELAEQAKRSMDKALKGERFVDVVHQNDQDIYYEMDWNPVYNDAFEITGLTTFVRDVTARKQAEEIVQNNNVYLEQKVRERTQELELSNDELEAFSSSVAHDLRNPLRTIDGFAQILLEDYADVLDSEAKRLLNVMKLSALKMDNIIKALLHLARITHNEVYMSPIDMKKMINKIWQEIQPENKDSVILNMSELPEALGDCRLIQLIWDNLLSNAIKFSLHQPVREITISGVKKEQFVEYCISDTGVGFDMNFYNKLFKVFHRLHSDKEYAGLGIGLSIAQRIVKKHGGEIWATAKVGKGASFHFTLPVVA
jgi:PAS domain S-box-containing protein